MFNVKCKQNYLLYFAVFGTYIKKSFSLKDAKYF